MDTLILRLFSDPTMGSLSWEALQMPALFALIVACLGFGIWSVRSRAQADRNAMLETELHHRRINDMVRASDERLRSRLQEEFDRTRVDYDQRSSEEWGRAMTELNRGFKQLEDRLLGTEKQFAQDQDLTAARLNEAMVIIQQAGLAALRADARWSGGARPA